MFLVCLSTEEQDEEADWLCLAGLSDLVAPNDDVMQELAIQKDPNTNGRESVSSMTVLSTLTRPQREAVLRRVTSFNKSQMVRYFHVPLCFEIFDLLVLAAFIRFHNFIFYKV